MVIHEDNEAPDEVSIIKNAHLELKKYVIVKNHVRELTINEETEVTEGSTVEKAPEVQKLKKAKKSTKKPELSTSSAQKVVTEKLRQDSDQSTTDISKSDLEELRTVYNKCKDVMMRIESKYGHLIGIENPSSHKNPTESDECNCKMNKKIIFDEDGQQLLKETNSEIHICHKKLKRSHSDAYEPDFHNTLTNNSGLDIEYEELSKSLPDDLQSLGTMLKDSDIGITYRNMVIDKIKMIKQEYTNEIKFNKRSLIEKLKAKSDEVFEFKGANLSTLPGYPN